MLVLTLSSLHLLLSSSTCIPPCLYLGCPTVFRLNHISFYRIVLVAQVMQTKKVQMAGGTLQGEANPTWLKQPGDMYVMAFGGALVAYGMFQAVVGHYRLASGKGKMD